jgi:predicted RNA-binding Zn ribbon-like protein
MVTGLSVTIGFVPDRLAADLRFDTGAAWLDLVGTVGHADGPDPIERLPSPARLAEWLAREGLAPAGPAPGPAEVEAARELRGALRALARAALEHRPPPPAALAVVNRVAAADAPPVLRPGPGGLALAPPADVAAALSRVARQAAEHLAGPEAGHLHACEAEDCTMLFLDPSGRRRWCAPNRCGVRSRVREHRRRRRADAAPPA